MLVDILPQPRIYPETARLLGFPIESRPTFRFHNGDNRSLGQCVVLVTKRQSGTHDPEAVEALFAFADQGEAVWAESKPIDAECTSPSRASRCNTHPPAT